MNDTFRLLVEALILEFLNKDAVVKRLEKHPEFVDKILALDPTPNHVYSPKLSKFFLEKPEEHHFTHIKDFFTRFLNLIKRKLLKKDINTYKNFKEFSDDVVTIENKHDTKDVNKDKMTSGNGSLEVCGKNIDMTDVTYKDENVVVVRADNMVKSIKYGSGFSDWCTAKNPSEGTNYFYAYKSGEYGEIGKQTMYYVYFPKRYAANPEDLDAVIHFGVNNDEEVSYTNRSNHESVKTLLWVKRNFTELANVDLKKAFPYIEPNPHEREIVEMDNDIGDDEFKRLNYQERLLYLQTGWRVINVAKWEMMDKGMKNTYLALVEAALVPIPADILPLIIDKSEGRRIMMGMDGDKLYKLIKRTSTEYRQKVIDFLLEYRVKDLDINAISSILLNSSDKRIVFEKIDMSKILDLGASRLGDIIVSASPEDRNFMLSFFKNNFQKFKDDSYNFEQAIKTFVSASDNPVDVLQRVGPDIIQSFSSSTLNDFLHYEGVTSEFINNMLLTNGVDKLNSSSVSFMLQKADNAVQMAEFLGESNIKKLYEEQIDTIFYTKYNAGKIEGRADSVISLYTFFNKVGYPFTPNSIMSMISRFREDENLYAFLDAINPQFWQVVPVYQIMDYLISSSYTLQFIKHIDFNTLVKRLDPTHLSLLIQNSSDMEFLQTLFQYFEQNQIVITPYLTKSFIRSADEKAPIIARLIGQERINELGDDDIAYLLVSFLNMRTDLNILVQSVGLENLKKMSGENVNQVLLKTRNPEKLIQILGADFIKSKLEPSDYTNLIYTSRAPLQLVKVFGREILQDVSEYTIASMVIDNIKNIRSVIPILGIENIRKIHADSYLLSMLINSLPKDYSLMINLIGKDKINLLPAGTIATLLTGEDGIWMPYAELLGRENLNKLTDKEISHIVDYMGNTSKKWYIPKILGKEKIEHFLWPNPPRFPGTRPRDYYTGAQETLYQILVDLKSAKSKIKLGEIMNNKPTVDSIVDESIKHTLNEFFTENVSHADLMKVKEIEAKTYPRYMQYINRNIGDDISIEDIANYLECDVSEVFIYVGDNWYILACVRPNKVQIEDLACAGGFSINGAKKFFNIMKGFGDKTIVADCKEDTSYRMLKKAEALGWLNIESESTWDWGGITMYKIRMTMNKVKKPKTIAPEKETI